MVHVMRHRAENNPVTLEFKDLFKGLPDLLSCHQSGRIDRNSPLHHGSEDSHWWNPLPATRSSKALAWVVCVCLFRNMWIWWVWGDWRSMAQMQVVEYNWFLMGWLPATRCSSIRYALKPTQLLVSRWIPSGWGRVTKHKSHQCRRITVQYALNQSWWSWCIIINSIPFLSFKVSQFVQ